MRDQGPRSVFLTLFRRLAMKPTRHFTASRIVAGLLCLSLAGIVLLLKSATWFEVEVPLISMLDGSKATGPLTPFPATQAVPEVAIDPLPDDLVALAPAIRQKDGSEGLLARELLRQAILIAARDELGLRTRDASLREIDGDAHAAALGTLRPVAYSPLNGRDGRMAIGVKRVDERLEKYAATIPAGDGDRLAYLARELEAHSRGSLVEELLGLGFKSQNGRAQARADDQTIPAKDPEEELCNRFDLISQFAAIRGWHSAIRTSGETPERLTGLVRGYSNLGFMTSHHWSPAQKAYRARALLYAERLLHRTGETPESLRTRAYARSLAGLPAAAKEDLKKARRLAPADEEPPGFVPVLEAHSAGDERQLAVLAKRGDRHDRVLANLLRLADARLAGSDRHVNSVAEAILDDEPACARALDALIETTMPLGTRRGAQDRILATGPDWLYGPLSKAHLPLPVKFRGDDDDPRTEPVLRQRLTEKILTDEMLREDASEPSLFALGRLIEEEGFIQAGGVIGVHRWALGVDADDLIERTLPWAWHHPLRPYLESFVWDQASSSAPYKAALLQLAREELVPAHKPLLDALIRTDGDNREEIEYFFWNNCDLTSFDLTWLVYQAGTSEERRRQVRRLERVAPDAATTVALLARYDGDRVAGRATEWETRFVDNAFVMKALGELHVEELNIEEALRCFTTAAETIPDHSTLFRLADIYLYLGDDDRYVQTLMDSLAYPSPGLEDAKANEKLAYHYMRLGDYRKALPYGQAAADSYSGWGLQCAAHCYEGLGDFDAAETLYRAISERYRGSDVAWYAWCLRTGRGDVEAARAAAQETFGRWRQFDTDGRRKSTFAFYDLAEGRFAEALDLYVQASDASGIERETLFAALLADQLGDSALRDERLAKVLSGSVSNYSLDYCAEAIRDDLAGRRLEADAALAGVRRTSYAWGVATEAYFLLGWYFENRDRLEEARQFYRLAAASPVIGTQADILASIALRRLGEEAGKRRRYEMDEVADRACVRYGGAYDYFGNGRYRAALLRIDKVLHEAPDFVPAIDLRAYVLAGLERFDEAAEALLTIYETSSRRNDARLRAASALEKSGQHRRAIELYEAVLASDATVGEKATAHEFLSWLRASCEDPALRNSEAALRHADAAASELSPEIAARTKAVALAAAGRFDEAIACAEEARKRFFGADRFRLDLQLALYRSGRPYVRTGAWWRFDAGYADEPLENPAAQRPVEAPRPAKPSGGD